MSVLISTKFNRRCSGFLSQFANAQARFNDGRESTVSVHDLAHVGNKYDRRKPKLTDQHILVEKRTTEVEGAEFDIHSKQLCNPDIHLLVPSNFDEIRGEC